jgi:hypothetical protein
MRFEGFEDPSFSPAVSRRRVISHIPPDRENGGLDAMRGIFQAPTKKFGQMGFTQG